MKKNKKAKKSIKENKFRSAHTESSKHKNSDTSKKNNRAKGFVKKYPGFVIALVVVIALLIVAVALMFPQSEDDTFELNMYSKMYHQDNQSYFDEVIASIDTELENGEFDSVLNDDYLYSIRDDIVWLKEKESEIYLGYNGKELFTREVAFMQFSELVLSLNETFSYDILEPEYEATISLAQEKEFSVPEIIGIEDLQQIFAEEGGNYSAIFDETIKSLSTEYFNMKRAIVNGNSSIERRFVEAKKIIYFFG